MSTPRVKASYIAEKGLVYLGEGLAVPATFTATVDDPELPYLVELEVVLDTDTGRLVCEALTCRRREGGEPVTTDGMRALPVARLLRLAGQRVLIYGRPKGDKLDMMFAGVIDAQVDLSRPTDDALRVVAGTYRLAFASGEHPTKAVMERFGLPRSTAARWVMKARERGFLGPTTKGKAGEAAEGE